MTKSNTGTKGFAMIRGSSENTVDALMSLTPGNTTTPMIMIVTGTKILPLRDAVGRYLATTQRQVNHGHQVDDTDDSFLRQQDSPNDDPCNRQQSMYNDKRFGRQQNDVTATRPTGNTGKPTMSFPPDTIFIPTIIPVSGNRNIPLRQRDLRKHNRSNER